MQPIDLQEVKERELLPGYHVRFVHSENMTLAYWNINAGAVLPEHSHVHEQISHIIEGEFELTLSGEVLKLTKDDIAIIPSNAIHSGKAITACKMVDTFNPVREEYK